MAMSSSSWTGSRPSISISVGTENDTLRTGGLPIQIGDTNRDASGDSCAYYALESGRTCRKARSCYDCLNTPVNGDHHGCVLTPQGSCQAMSRYDYRSDFQRNVSTTSNNNGWYNFFPATNATYCEPSDAACARCRKIADIELAPLADPALALTNSSDIEATRQFCTGASGCVCVVLCEYATWNETVADQCPSSDPFAPQQTAIAEVQTYRALFPIFMCLQMALLGTVVYRRRMFALRRARHRAVADGPYNNVQAIASPSNRLRLSGWRAARETQMQREKQPRMYLHLETPAHLEFVEERQQELTSNSSSSSAGAADEARTEPVLGPRRDSTQVQLPVIIETASDDVATGRAAC